MIAVAVIKILYQFLNERKACRAGSCLHEAVICLIILFSDGKHQGIGYSATLVFLFYLIIISISTYHTHKHCTV